MLNSINLPRYVHSSIIHPTNSERLKGILDLIPKQILKNQNEILEKFNITRNFLDQVYNIYLSEFFLTAFSSEEKKFLYSLRLLNHKEKKSY